MLDLAGYGSFSTMSHVLSLLAAAFLLLAPGAKNYDIQTSAGPARAGQAARATVKLVTKNGFHVNKDYPIALDVAGSEGVSVDKAKLAKGDVKLTGETEASFDVGFKAGKAGKAQLEATFRFAVCTDKDCFPAKEKVVIALDVK